MKSKKYGKILAALLCAGLLAGWHAPPVFAVDITVTVTEENQTEIQGTFELADTDIDTAVTDKEKQSVAIGTNAEANREGSTAIGYGAKANHKYATVVGNGAEVSTNYSTALGYKAYAVGANSVAIGYGSQNSQGGTVSFGALGVVNKITGAPDYRNLEGIKDVYVNGGIIFTDKGAGSYINLQQGELRGVTKINGVLYSSDTNNNTYSIGNIVFDNNGQVTSINSTDFSKLVNTDLSSITGEIESLESSVGEITSNVGSIKNEISGIGSSISGIQSDITSIKNDIGNLQNSSGNVDGEDINPNSVTTDKITVGDADSGTQTVIDNTGATFTSDEGTTTINGGGVTTTTVNATDIKATNVTAATVTTGQTTVNNAGVSIADKTVITDSDVVINKGTAGQVSLADVWQRMTVAENRIDRLGKEVDEVGALGAALAGLHPMDTNSRTDIAVALGSYDGNQAVALGAFYRPDKRTMLSVGASATDSRQMFNMGVSFALDRLPEKPAADSEVLAAVMARLEKLEAENAQLRAQYAELKEQTAQ